MPPIKCLLFDCDNTLVLSEIAAFEACAQLANEILKEFGFDVVYTGHQLMSDFVGQNFRGMMNGLCARHNFEIPPKRFDEYVARELDAVIANIRQKCKPCIGVIDVLKKLDAEKKYKLAIVSSSAMPRVVASIEVTNMDHFFEGPEKGIFSAASSIDPPTSKPNPAIYLHACKVLGYKPSECIAIEDSRSGATAAKNAGIPLLGYVGPYYDEPKEKLDQMIELFSKELGSFDVMHNWSEFEGILNKYESS